MANRTDVRAILTRLRRPEEEAAARRELYDALWTFHLSMRADAELDRSIKLGDTALWTDLLKRIVTEFKEMTPDEAAENFDLAVVMNLPSGTINKKRVAHENMRAYATSLLDGIAAQQVTLLATTDAAFLRLFRPVAERDATLARFYNLFVRRFREDVEALDGSVEALQRCSIIYAGEPLLPLCLRLRARAVADFRPSSPLATAQVSLAIVYTPASGFKASVPVAESDLPDVESAVAVYDELRERVHIDKRGNESRELPIVLDLRQQYAVYRRWAPAVLTWSLDAPTFVPPPKRNVAKKQKKTPAAADTTTTQPTTNTSPSQPPPPSPNTSTSTTTDNGEPASTTPVLESPRSVRQSPVLPISMQPRSAFEKGEHMLSETLNGIWAHFVPPVGAATTLRRDVLRLLVLALQLAFDGAPLDGVMRSSSISDFEVPGESIYDGHVRPLLSAAGIDTSVALVRNDAALLDRFDAVLQRCVEQNHVILFGDETPAHDSLSDERRALDSSRYPRLLRFLWSTYLRPFGNLGHIATNRLRGIIKAQYTGALSRSDVNLFTADERAALASGGVRARASLLNSVVVDATRAMSKDMFTVTPARRGMQQVQFTRDLQVAHHHARLSRDTALLRRLGEVYQILGDAAGLVFAEEPLAQFLRRLTGGRSGDIHYTLERGFFVSNNDDDDTPKAFSDNDDAIDDDDERSDTTNLASRYEVLFHYTEPPPSTEMGMPVDARTQPVVE